MSKVLPDAYVFPGGSVEQTDSSEAALGRLFAARQAVEQESAPLLFAAIRELFEEAGILLACDHNGESLRDRSLAHADQRRLSFIEFLQSRDLFADARQLVPFSQWVTPLTIPQRFDAHFFLARASHDQVAMADAVETHDDVWIAPRAALERSASGDLNLVYPTIKHLERLAEFDDISNLMEFARTKPIVPILPETTADGFHIPPELEFAW